MLKDTKSKYNCFFNDFILYLIVIGHEWTKRMAAIERIEGVIEVAVAGNRNKPQGLLSASIACVMRLV